MCKIGRVVQLLLSIVVLFGTSTGQTEEEVARWLDEYDEEILDYCNRLALANWDVQTNIGNSSFVEVQRQRSLEYADVRSRYYNLRWSTLDPNDPNFENVEIKRQIKFLQDIGNAALDPFDLNDFNTIVNRMTTIYNTAVVCPFTNQNCNPDTDSVLTLDPHLAQLMAESTSYDELEYLWTQWREQSGRKMQGDYVEYVGLMKKIATANGYNDASEMWQARYEKDGFEDWIDGHWDDMKELYDELHKYVRFKLLELYGNRLNASDPLIPAHLLGNMWAQSWVNLYDRIKPFKDGSIVDVTAKLQERGYTVHDLFEISNDFFMSMGLEDNSVSYGPTAVITKPEDRIVACHPQAWDFCDGEDFRIKMCTNINMVDFVTIHHEMGHIQYYLQYKDKKLVLRGGANPGFHEAVGDTIALSVASTTHLQQLGLVEDYADTEEDNINALFNMALGRVAFLPFGLLIDKWRWQVFQGLPQERWNEEWWNLRRQYQKIKPPSVRDADYFDPGAKFHVPDNSQYITYFISYVLQFQMYRALCIEAGQYDPNNKLARPLHKCDFYNSTAAGDKLRAGLRLGMTKVWNEALYEITGERDISTSAFLEYFDPLLTFLKTQNVKLEDENEHRVILQTYDEEASSIMGELMEASWNVATDVNNIEKQQTLFDITKSSAEFMKTQFDDVFSKWQESDFTDASLQRQLKFLRNIGVAALDDAKLGTLTETKTRMESIYNNGKVCPIDNRNCNEVSEGLSLDPELTEIVAVSRDYNELLYYWTGWHDNVGTEVKDLYETYVELSNEVAELNNFTDYGAMWRSDYEDDNFLDNMEKLWQQVEPLYTELHAYVRRRLVQKYGDVVDTGDGLIPAHLFGNMWAQAWNNIYDITKPYENGTELDVTPALIENFSVLEMFQESDRFFQDLGLEVNDMSYATDKSMIIKPDNRTVACHASAWDFYDGKDFRIKMCTSINMEDFITVHHEMGHIQYFILYKDQPLVFKAGANPGFHEAVGDLIALSVSSTTHLAKMNLLRNYTDSYVNDINALFKMALERVAFLPFGYIIDLYRWEIFSNLTAKEKWNDRWWELREQYQKIKSPVERHAEHFDAGAKFHIPADYQYINYFVARILQFQLHEKMCTVAGQYDPENPDANPLFKCDIDGSKDAGAILRAGLSLGMSEHWSVALERMTGATELNAEPLLKYFQPLYDFLKAANEADVENGSSNYNNRIPIVVGSAVGGLLAFVIIGLSIYYLKRRKTSMYQR